MRDIDGKLVISHDPALRGALSVKDFFSAYKQHAQNLPLALNIKADCLQKMLATVLSEYQIQNYFVFDMSVPDMIGYINAGLRVFTRQSEYEPNPVLYEQSQGVWADSFNENWIDEATLENHLNRGKQVCLVSPDLHGRPFEAFWERLARMSVTTSPELMICTDHPEQARKIFHE